MDKQEVTKALRVVMQASMDHDQWRLLRQLTRLAEALYDDDDDDNDHNDIAHHENTTHQPPFMKRSEDA